MSDAFEPLASGDLAQVVGGAFPPNYEPIKGGGGGGGALPGMGRGLGEIFEAVVDGSTATPPYNPPPRGPHPTPL